jgi:hypothetical protein
MTLAKAMGVAAGYLLITQTIFSLMEPEGLGWTLGTAGAGMGIGTLAFLLVRRAGQRRFTTVLGREDDSSSS